MAASSPDHANPSCSRSRSGKRSEAGLRRGKPDRAAKKLQPKRAWRNSYHSGVFFSWRTERRRVSNCDVRFAKALRMSSIDREIKNSTQQQGSESLYTIGELSREFDISLRTLRFYEGRGFLDCIRIGQKRLYSEAHRKRLKTILHARKLGFSLAEIGELLSSSPDVDSVSTLSEISSSLLAAQIELLEQRQSDIRAALAELRQEQQRREQCA